MKSMNSNTEPGQPCINSNGRRVGSLAWDMQKVQVVVRPRHLELREGVQARLLRAPIELAAPIVDEAPQVVDACPVEPGVARRRIGKTGAREALAQVLKLTVRNMQCERLRHRRYSS